MKKIFCFASLLFFYGLIYAQIGLTNTGALHISSGTYTVHVEGAFNNTASATFVNNGSLNLRGGLTNNQAAMTVGTGALNLNGTLSQVINGGQTFKTNNLITANNSGIVLSNNLSIAGIHTFNAGSISSTTNTNFLIYEAGSSYTGQANDKHVSGWVKKLGTTAFTFPMGNGTYLREIAVTNLTGSPEFTAHYEGITTNISNVQSPLLSVDPYEYWTLNEASGTATAQVTLNWDKSKINFPNWALNDIRAAHYSSGLWTNRGGTATGSPTTSGSITSTSLNSFGAMAIGSTSVVLPLLFLDIQANKLPNFTTVTWQTTNEENVARQEVQRSVNGSDFITIGTVPAKNRRQTQTYSFNDYSNTNTSYYRIKSIDFDGKYMYSKVVVVSTNLSESLTLLTNPVKTNISLVVTGITAGKYSYQLFSADGTSTLNGIAYYDGSGRIDIPLKQSIAKGTYLLLINIRRNYLQKVIVN